MNIVTTPMTRISQASRAPEVREGLAHLPAVDSV